VTMTNEAEREPMKLTAEQADAAAELLEKLRSTDGGVRTNATLTGSARQILVALLGRYARTARAVRHVSPVLLPLLPGDDRADYAAEFANFADAEAWYLANADGIFDALVLADQYEVDEYSCQVVRSLECVLTSLHDTDRRRVLSDLALASARRLGDRAAEVHALLNRGGAYKMANLPALAIKDYEQAAAMVAELDDGAGTVAVLSRLAVAYTTARRLDDAEAVLVKVLSLAETGEAHRGMAYVNRAWIATEGGQSSTAIEHGLEGLKVLRACDADQLWIIEAHLELTKAYTSQGDIERARHHLDAVYTILAGGFETFPVRISAAIADAELMLAEGRLFEAMAAFQHVIVVQAAGPSPYRMADTADGMGRVLFELGEYGAAVDEHNAALVERTRAGEPFSVARTGFYLARATFACRRVGEAVLLRDQALADLAGIVDPAADTLRAQLNELTGDIAPRT
jgi:tetratricopeptide (TPR) repeat protein